MPPSIAALPLSRPPRRGGLLPLAALLLSLPAGALAAQDEVPTDERLHLPAFKLLRQDEDWSVLQEPERLAPGETTWLESWKYQPLDDSGQTWLGIGGEARLRVESWSNFGFGGAPPGADDDDAYVLERLLLHADLHTDRGLRFFVQGKHASALEDRELPGGNRTVDVDNLSLAQAFVDVPLGSDDPHTLRVGRQWLALGSQRLVSPRGWGNAQRSFDGVSGVFHPEDWTLSAFFTVYAPEQKHDFNDGNREEQLGGVYATRPLDDGGQLDLYALYATHDRRTYNGTTGDDQRLTLGGRRLARFGDFDAEAEAAVQVGEVGREKVLASMISLVGGWTAPGVEGRPRLHVGLDYASGDRRAGGRVQTFDQLYPLGHAYLGNMDYIGRQNILDLSAGVTVQPQEGTTARIDVHGYWRPDPDDAIYNVGGGVVRPGLRRGARQVGCEVDLKLGHRFRRNLTGEVGYCHLFPGKALRESGPSQDADFVYAALQILF